MYMWIYRGLPGAGKSTMAGPGAFAADDYFVTEEGVYRFDASKLSAAHADCQARVRAAMLNGQNVSIANTFSQRWEMEPYLRLANDLTLFKEPWVVTVIDLFDGGGLTDQQLAERNVHGVTAEIIARMRARWEHDWEAGNPLPPWER